MNFTLIIVFFIIVLSTVHGYKKGLAKEISGLISCAVTLFVISLLIMLYTSFNANEGINTIFTIVILVTVTIIYSIIRFFLKPVKLIVKLPLLRMLDKILGIFVGVIEGFLLVCLMYVLNEGGIFGVYGEMIDIDTARSQILSLIYEYNYLIKIAAGF